MDARIGNMLHRLMCPKAISKRVPRYNHEAHCSVGNTQAEAVASTERRLQQEQSPGQAAAVRLHVGCHSQMREMLAPAADSAHSSAAEYEDPPPPPQPRLICFNLGEGGASRASMPLQSLTPL